MEIINFEKKEEIGLEEKIQELIHKNEVAIRFHKQKIRCLRLDSLAIRAVIIPATIIALMVDVLVIPFRITIIVNNKTDIYLEMMSNKIHEILSDDDRPFEWSSKYKNLRIMMLAGIGAYTITYICLDNIKKEIKTRKQLITNCKENLKILRG